VTNGQMTGEKLNRPPKTVHTCSVEKIKAIETEKVIMKAKPDRQKEKGTEKINK